MSSNISSRMLLVFGRLELDESTHPTISTLIGCQDVMSSGGILNVASLGFFQLEQIYGGD